MWVHGQTSGFKIGSISELPKILSVLRFIILPCLALSLKIQTLKVSLLFF